MQDTREKMAKHYVWLSEQPGWAEYSRHRVKEMEAMDLYRGLREKCNELRIAKKAQSLESTQEPTPGWPSIGTGS